MDDITVYGMSFEESFINLETTLHRCIWKNLVLNWEKCHFMVNQGIALGHIILEKGIEVDKAEIDHDFQTALSHKCKDHAKILRVRSLL